MSQDDISRNGATIQESSTDTNNHVETKKVYNDKETNISCEATVQVLQEQMQELSSDITNYVNNRIRNVMSEVSGESKTKMRSNGKQSIDKSIENDVQRNPSNGKIYEKKFIQRNSILTDLFENKHISTIYYVFAMMLMIISLDTALDDYVKTGSLDVATGMIRYCFRKLDVTFFIWLLMTLVALNVYSAFNVWAQKRFDLPPNSLTIKIWDYGWLLCFILFVIVFLIFPTKAVLYADLSIASSVTILMEQARMLMKSYAYVRSVAPRFLSYKPHNEKDQPEVPKFSQFLYFFFAPTLVYRDSYPRTKNIRWRKVIWNYAEVMLIIFYIAIISKRFLEPLYIVFYKEPVDTVQFLRSMLSSMIPAMIYFLGAFYCLLHAWMNAWAEMLRFADRMFYMDWWNARSYSAFYRSWNTVVYDWLYTYIYKDMYEIVTNRNRVASACTVFLISAVYHEYIISFALRFFYPVMFISFCGLGLMLMFFTKKASSLFMWFTYFIGVGFMVSLYGIEINARLYCEPHENKLLDIFLPRSWYCYRRTGI